MKYLKMSQVVLALTLAGGSGAAYAQGAAPPAAPSTGDTTNSALEEQNKALVLRLYSEVFAGGDEAVASEIISPDAVEHGQVEGQGVEGQLAVFDELRSRIPNVVATVKHTAADGDFVAVQWHASATPDDELSGEERIDFFRVEDGQIVEAWLASEAIAPISNGLTPFGDLYVYPDGAPTLTEEQEQANLVFVRDGRAWDPEFFQHGVGGPFGIDDGDDDDDAGGAPGGAPGGAAPGGAPGGAAPGGAPGGAAPGGAPGGAAPGGAPGGAPDGGAPPGGGGGFGGFQAVAWLADGDLVWELNSLGANGFLVDLYRVVDNLIVEHYDIAPLPGGGGGPPGGAPPAQ